MDVKKQQKRSGSGALSFDLEEDEEDEEEGTIISPSDLILFRVSEMDMKKQQKTRSGSGALSFDLEEDEEDEEEEGTIISPSDLILFRKNSNIHTNSFTHTHTHTAPSPPKPKKKRLGKNPAVDTSFLPDREREVTTHTTRSCDYHMITPYCHVTWRRDLIGRLCFSR